MNPDNSAPSLPAPGRLRTGTLLKGTEDPARMIQILSNHGFESWSIMFWESLEGTDPARLADSVLKSIELYSPGSVISSLSVFGNPLRGDERGNQVAAAWKSLLDAAPRFAVPGAPPPLVSGFAGRLPGTSVESSIEAWQRFFGPLAERAHTLGTSLAFENCRMGDTWKTGIWNIAINPDAWELMFAAMPGAPIGLEWEPCHQVEALVEPLGQLEAWVPRIIHVHGKDARTDQAKLASHGLYGRRRVFESCLPGNGDTDWKKIYSILTNSGYQGTVDIEGWNDRDWAGDREVEGQVRAFRYLLSCRGQG